MSRTASTFLTEKLKDHFHGQEWWRMAPKPLKDKASIARAAGAEIWTSALPIEEEMFSASLPDFFFRDCDQNLIWKHQGLRASVIRRLLGITSSKCASMVGVSQPAISQHERGMRRISELKQTKLAKVLKVADTFLIGGVHLDPKSADEVRRKHRLIALSSWDGEDIPEYAPRQWPDGGSVLLAKAPKQIGWIVPKTQPIDCPDALLPWYRYMRDVVAVLKRK